MPNLHTCAVLLLLGCGLQAQVNPKLLKKLPTVVYPKLIAGEVVKTPQQNMAFLLPVKCDGDGNIFLRGMFPTGQMAQAVVRLAADGQNEQVFNVWQIDGMQDAQVIAFAPDATGDLYELVGSTKNGYELVSFDHDGQFRSRTSLDLSRLGVGLGVGSFVPFTASLFFLTGSSAKEKSASFHMTNAIINDSGQVVKDLTLANDLDLSSLSARQAEEVYLGDAVAGPDGNVYLIRHDGNTALIYVISPGGEVLRNFRVSTPLDGGTPSLMVPEIGKIAVEFRKSQGLGPDISRISVINSQTGDFIEAYDGSADLGSLACYANDLFTFVDNERGYMELIHAVVQQP